MNIRSAHRSNRVWILGSVVVGWFLSFGIRMIYPVLAEHARADFSMTNTDVGFLFTLIMATYAVSQFPSGLLADQTGEKPILLLSLSITTVATILLTVSPIYALFGLGCILFGFGTGLYQTPQVSLLSKVFPDRPGAAHGVAFGGGGLGAILPVTAGIIATRLNWRLGFAFTVPFLVLTVLFQRRIIPNLDSNDDGRATLDRGRLRSMKSAISTNSIVTAFVSVAFVSMALNAIFSFFPLYLTDVKGASSLHASVLFGAFFVAGTALQIGMGGLADRFGSSRIMFGSAAMGSGALIAITAVENALLIAVLVLPLGAINATISLGNTYLIEQLPEEVQAGGLGILRSVFILAGSASPVVTGFLADRGLFSESLVAFGALTGIAAVLSLHLKGD